MNILQIVSSSRVSGAEMHCLVLSSHLQQRGHHVTVVCPPGGWLPQRLRDAKLDVIEWPMRGTQMPRSVFRISKLVKSRQIHLIHAHLTRATYLGFYVNKLIRVPVVSSVHVRSRDVMYCKLFPARDKKLITVSNWVRETFLEQGVRPEHAITIYNGTDFVRQAESFAPSELYDEFGVPEESLKIGIFGHVGTFKGHFLLVEAMAKILKSFPSAYLFCVGHGEPETFESLTNIARQGSYEDRLVFTHTRNDVGRLLTAMDVVALPSEYEACSMAIIEAMAIGRPVVATNAGGNPELIRNGETGMLIDRSSDSVAESIMGLLGDSQLRLQMGQDARQRATDLFSSEKMVDHIESLYQQLTSAKSKALAPEGAVAG